MFEVVPDPALASGQIEIVDCSSNVRFANGGILWVNGNDIDCNCLPATETSSWGKIKSLYH